MKFYVISDERAKVREAFVMPEPEPDEPDPLDGYSGWFTVASFDSVEEAKAFCDSYNEYEGESDVSFSCCSRGCTMCAYDAAHSTGYCAHEGE